MIQYDWLELQKVIEKGRKVGTGRSLIAVLRSLDLFYPEGSRELQRNLKQESGLFRILCYKKERSKVCWVYDLEI